jgi:ribosomal protein L29
MAHKIIDELKGLNQAELQVKIDSWRRELFGLRLNASTSHIKDYSQFKKLRKNIARGLTLLTQQPQESVQADAAHKE